MQLNASLIVAHIWGTNGEQKHTDCNFADNAAVGKGNAVGIPRRAVFNIVLMEHDEN